MSTEEVRTDRPAWVRYAKWRGLTPGVTEDGVWYVTKNENSKRRSKFLKFVLNRERSKSL